MLPVGRLAVEITTAGAFTWMDNALEAELLAESVAKTVNEERPEVVGEPEILPEEFMLRPAGKAPALMLNVMAPVPPEAATAAV
jgi:hypothetical protein